jgi:hypothetical protein
MHGQIHGVVSPKDYSKQMIISVILTSKSVSIDSKVCFSLGFKGYADEGN